jgi:hypothetical protein
MAGKQPGIFIEDFDPYFDPHSGGKLPIPQEKTIMLPVSRPKKLRYLYFPH